MMVNMVEGELLEVRMTVRVPVACTYDEAEEWIEIQMGARGDINNSNPLIDHALEEWANSLVIDLTDRIGIREEYNHETRDDGATYYNVRYRTVPVTAQS